MEVESNMMMDTMKNLRSKKNLKVKNPKSHSDEKKEQDDSKSENAKDLNEPIKGRKKNLSESKVKPRKINHERNKTGFDQTDEKEVQNIDYVKTLMMKFKDMSKENQEKAISKEREAFTNQKKSTLFKIANLK